MTIDAGVLIITAASIAFLHTIFGPDHYLPFVMIAWARKWSGLKTSVITFFCGLAHITSSVVLGLIGVALGLAVEKLELVESYRGNLAAWLVIGFGLVYFGWGLRQAYKNRPHVHDHTHTGGMGHSHSHNHHREHAHLHALKTTPSIAPWTLFVIFILGPCEPLIPILMYPAAQKSYLTLVLVVAVFGIVTIITMLGMVLFSLAGVRFLPLARVERFAPAIAGATICLCGLAIQFMGL